MGLCINRNRSTEYINSNKTYRGFKSTAGFKSYRLKPVQNPTHHKRKNYVALIKIAGAMQIMEVNKYFIALFFSTKIHQLITHRPSPDTH